MEIFKGQNILNHVKEFPDDDSYRAYLSKIKWLDGFKCTKCGCERGWKNQVTTTIVIAVIM